MYNDEKYLEIGHLLQNLRESPLFVSIFQIASIWIVSDISYEAFKIVWGSEITYTGDPILITIYYLFWIFVTLSAFWNIFLKWQIIKNEIASYALVLFVIGFIATYIIYIFPEYPTIAWTHDLKPPAELVYNSGWYFLPKSAEIILQQLLVYALVLSFHRAKYKLNTISLWCAGLFGSAHLLLVLGGPSLWYISLFTMSASIAGFIFPRLILKTKDGFIYSYMLHWTFYAILIFVLKKLIFT